MSVSKKKQIVEIELLEDMYEYTVTINGIKRAIPKGAYNTLNDIMTNYPLNQSPQLSDDVEEAVEKVENVFYTDEEKAEYGNTVYYSVEIKDAPAWKLIKQYIQAITNENKRLKEAIEASQTNAQSLGEWTLQQWDKLNKISEVCNKEFKSFGYGDLQNLIKSILTDKNNSSTTIKE